jgi:hypothetical protein
MPKRTGPDYYGSSVFLTRSRETGQGLQAPLNQSLAGPISQINSGSASNGDMSPRPGHKSLSLAFCFATKCCMNLGP